VRFLPVLGLLTLAVFAPGAPAFAHDEVGVLAGEYVAEPPDAPEGTYRVRLTYQNDGHPAEGATVTMTASDGAGSSVGPLPMNAVDLGEYEAAVTFPHAGSWTVSVVAEAPAATLEQPLTIAEPPPSTTTTSATKVQTDPIGDPRDDGGGGLGAGLWIGVVGVLVAAVVAGVVIWRRRVAAP
jgi:hypothetical protein